MSKASSRRFSVVSSGGGFSNLPQPSQDDTTPLSVGYFGSLNFAKLHPAYVDFLSSVDIPDFRVRLIGDLLNRDVLERQCAAAGRPRMLDFRGYTTDVATELRAINVMAYLLNPCHYGTAENALLEAMAMGIVPIVLDNPAERCIVEDRVTGLVVRSPGEFAKAVEWLERHPQERSSMGMRAAESVRERFSLKKMEESFRRHYEDLLQETKRPVPFQAVFGTTPEDWFLSCQREPERFEKSGEISLPTESMASFNLLEKTKGSVFHFHEYFPEAAGLKAWAGRLEASR